MIVQESNVDFIGTMTDNMYKGNREDQDLHHDGPDSKRYNDAESALDGLGIKQAFRHAANTGTIDVSEMTEILFELFDELLLTQAPRRDIQVGVPKTSSTASLTIAPYRRFAPTRSTLGEHSLATAFRTQNIAANLLVLETLAKYCHDAFAGCFFYSAMELEYCSEIKIGSLGLSKFKLMNEVIAKLEKKNRPEPETPPADHVAINFTTGNDPLKSQPGANDIDILPPDFKSADPDADKTTPLYPDYVNLRRLAGMDDDYLSQAQELWGYMRGFVSSRAPALFFKARVLVLCIAAVLVDYRRNEKKLNDLIQEYLLGTELKECGGIQLPLTYCDILAKYGPETNEFLDALKDPFPKPNPGSSWKGPRATSRDLHTYLEKKAILDKICLLLSSLPVLWKALTVMNYPDIFLLNLLRAEVYDSYNNYLRNPGVLLSWDTLAMSNVIDAPSKTLTFFTSLKSDIIDCMGKGVPVGGSSDKIATEWRKIPEAERYLEILHNNGTRFNSIRL